MGTGGLGGVHRGFPTPPDVSADLGACARIPAVIASSGVKSLLDVPATMELLETLGVPVIGYRVDTLPLFYAADGGPPVSARAEDAAEVARIADAHWRLGGNAILVGRPPDESLDVAGLIEEIVAEAHRTGRHRPGRDPVRARRAARAVGWRDAPGQPRPDRRERRACRRDRRRLHHTLTMALYDTVRDLPLVVEGYTLDGHEYVVSPTFTRKTTVIRLTGGGEEGLGEDVTYDGAEQEAQQARGPVLPLAGEWTIDSLSRHLGTLPLFAQRARARRVRRLPALGVRERRARPRAPPGGTIARRGRRARAAARDLRRLGRLGDPPSTARLRAFLALYPGCGSSSTHARTGRTRSSTSSRRSAASTRSTSRGSTRARSVDNPPDPASTGG